MSRTIILTETDDAGWCVSENGRHADRLGKDELLWTVVHLLVGVEGPGYAGLQSLSAIQAREYQRGVRDTRSGRVPPHKDPDHLPLPSESTP